MKVHLLSDLHLEFSEFVPPRINADLVILAGDIHTKCRGVEWANLAFECEVVYVCSNHEFYSGHIDHTLRKNARRIRTPCPCPGKPGVDSKRSTILVTTAWTDFTSTGDKVAPSMTCAALMNDFRLIRATESFRRLRPADVIERNRVAFDFLKRELSEPFDGKTVVVTHHCPVPEAGREKHYDHLSAAYFNSWHSLLPLVDVWIFGHTHRAVDTELHGCRIISNPLGYPREEIGFIPDFIIQI